MFPNWLKWTISLALLLTVGVLGIWWAGEIRTKTGSLTAPDFGWLEFWLNWYQTLIGGFVALGGAFLAFQAVRGQIAQLDRLEEQRRGRESYAARAVLPLALSSICDYAESCTEALVLVGSGTGVPKGWELPRIPLDSIDTLREAVRYSDSKQAKELADLISWIQVQHARLRSLSQGGRSSGTSLTVQQGILDLAEIYGRASDLFDYGRRSDEGPFPRLSAERIREVLRLQRIDEDDWPWVKARLASRSADPEL